MDPGRPIVGEPTSRAEHKAARRAERTLRKAARRARREARRARDDARREDAERAERARWEHAERGPTADPGERAHRRRVARARRQAHRRLGFVTHVGTWLATLALLLVATRSVRLVLFVGFAWGLGVFAHYLWAIVAPGLRDRWIEQEVGARSARDVASERRQVETRSRRSMEDLSASIAHEIRNPITAAKSLVQQMGEDPASRENLEYASLALSELDRVERSISHLLRYARDEEPRFEPVSLRAVARAALEGLRERASEAGIDLTLDFDGEGGMHGDFEKLRRVVENLIVNAIEALASAAPPAPRIAISGGESLAGDELWLRVADNGPGIPAEERERIWSPFHTTRADGTGLGLALSRKTVEAHGGRIALDPGAPVGTVFEITLPREASPRDAAARRHASEDPT